MKLTCLVWDLIQRIIMKKLLYCSITAIMMLFATAQMANNIQVSNISLTDGNTTDKFVMVQFDLSWENSWRTSSAPNNWDAAWVFVKYRITAANGGDGLWKHAWLNNSGHSSGTGTGATIDAGLLTPGEAFHTTSNPGLGVFIYRSADGTGTFSITGTQLRWNYGANVVADDATIEVQVFAIEMVYVLQGSFYVGSGGDEYSRFKNGTTNNSFQIISEGPLEIGNEIGKLWSSNTSTIGAAGTLAAAFPKGYNASYMQKYEITQQQYVDFLNTLTFTQQNNRIDGSPDASAGTFTNNVNRHKIKIQTSGVNPGMPAVYETEHPYVAWNLLSWMDGTAYSDWAGLRPMTELEFEKASRGTATPVANEYAWGTATVANNVYTLANAGAANEGIANNYSTMAGNAMHIWTNSDDPDEPGEPDIGIDGPLRAGIFAAHGSNTGRITSGASYYGIMELSGNLWEWTVTVVNATGRAFTGIHGDGALSANGHADVTDWPDLDSGEVIEVTGAGLRGGAWQEAPGNMMVSYRGGVEAVYTFRNNLYGFRAVRLAP